MFNQLVAVKRSVLVTGATGNVGGAVLRRLASWDAEVVGGVRDIGRAKATLPEIGCRFDVLDFEKGVFPERFFDAVFLVRPPHLADPEWFAPFLRSLSAKTRVVFLSVQGADRQGFLPHAKIERLIDGSGLPRTFVRPSYFMENLTTTLWGELREQQRIYLPASDLKFDWISVSDVAEVSALALIGDLGLESVEVCSDRRAGFGEAVEIINKICQTNFRYESPSVAAFLAYSLKRRHRFSYIFVMLLLHYFPRFGKPGPSSPCNFSRITGRPPQTLEQFVAGRRELFAKIGNAHRVAESNLQA